MDFFLFDTSLGPMALAQEEDCLTRLYLPGTPTPSKTGSPWASV